MAGQTSTLVFQFSCSEVVANSKLFTCDTTQWCMFVRTHIAIQQLQRLTLRMFYSFKYAYNKWVFAAGGRDAKRHSTAVMLLSFCPGSMLLIKLQFLSSRKYFNRAFVAGATFIKSPTDPKALNVVRNKTNL
jgi:hypothetical protein